MTDITKYLDFVLTLCFAFEICFEVPIFTIVMVWTGLITPIDAISQTLLTVPMWMLYKIGLLFSKLFVPNADTDMDEKDKLPVKLDK